MSGLPKKLEDPGSALTMMSTDQLHDFGGDPLSNSALGGLTEVDPGTSLPSGARFFRERLRLTTRWIGTWLDGGKGPLGSELGPNRIALILCILTDRAPCKQPE
jgi:hypothetical protein